MIRISYTTMVFAISVFWVLTRLHFCVKQKCINWKRELQLLLVYICLIVVTRFTFCPFEKVDGKIQPLLFL